jgi:hypothetical protein
MGQKLRSWYEPSWMREVLQPELEPGETIEAMADFTCADKDDDGKPLLPGRLFVLTDRNLRSFSFRSDLMSIVRSFRAKPQPIKSTYVVPLHRIGAIGETREGGLFTAEARTMALSAPGGSERWRTTSVEGAHLIDLLQAKVAARAAGPIGMAAELSKLAELKAEGILSEEEFQRAKELFVGATPDQQTEALDLLRQLHALQRSGVLSEMEFNMKKWEVLSRPERRPPG